MQERISRINRGDYGCDEVKMNKTGVQEVKVQGWGPPSSYRFSLLDYFLGSQPDAGVTLSAGSGPHFVLQDKSH